MYWFKIYSVQAITPPCVCFFKALALKENSLFCRHRPKQQITFHVTEGLVALLFFALSWKPQSAHTCTTSIWTHVCSVQGPSCTCPLASSDVNSELALTHAPSMATPFIVHKPNQIQVWSWERWFGLQYDPAPRRWAHTGSLPDTHHPILILTYGHKHWNTQAHHGRGYRLHRQHPPHPAGLWPFDRGHVAGRNASRCWALALTDLVLVCLPGNSSQKTEKEFCFSLLWLKRLPCSAHCCLLSGISPMAVWLQNLFFCLQQVLLLLCFLDSILAVFPGQKQKCVSFYYDLQ